MRIIESIQETLNYVKALEEAYEEVKGENEELRGCLEQVRTQLYDTFNCENVLTKAIDVVLNR